MLLAQFRPVALPDRDRAHTSRCVDGSRSVIRLPGCLPLAARQARGKILGKKPRNAAQLSWRVTVMVIHV